MTYFEDEHIRLLEGNVCEVLPTLAAGSVHAIATSPPYYGLRDYGLPPTPWPAVRYAPMAGLAPIEIPPVACCLGLESTLEAYVGHLVYIWRLLYRVLRDDGTCWLNLGSSYANDGKWGGSTGGKHVNGLHGNGCVGRTKQSTGLKAKDEMLVPHRVALALQADGWYLRSAVVWAKGISFCEAYAGSVMPESVRDRPTSAYEMVFLLSKQARYFYDGEAVKEDAVNGENFHGAYSGSGRSYQSRNGRSEANNTTATRNLRNVWAIRQPVMRLRKDLSDEKRAEVLLELMRRGLI